MKKLALGLLLVGMFAACSSEKKMVIVVTPDAKGQCNPLLNTGCAANQKCTWLIDALTPNYVGHIGCVPDGAKNVGDACTYGPAGELGYDDCKFGGVCTNFRNPMTNPSGVCKAVCDQQGGMPACDASHVCVVYANLFDLGETTPAAAGVCNVSCNPLTDNDFDGSGVGLTRSGTTCGSAAEGCYGSPSAGTPPVSGFSCTRDIHYGGPKIFGHRAPCTVAEGCADAQTMKPYQNSCSQGYLPLLYDMVGSTTVVCIQFCEPDNCFLGTGNCGVGSGFERTAGKVRASDEHRCAAADAVGDYDITAKGTSCQFLWRREIDSATMTYLPSQWSDKLGFCYDHQIYQYDSNMDNMADLALPACNVLKDGFGSGMDPAVPTEYFGAADLGCVDSTRLMVNGKAQIPESAMKKAAQIDMPHPLYDSRVYEPYVE